MFKAIWNHGTGLPTLPLKTKAYTMLVPHFREKKGIFFQNQEKMGNFSDLSLQNFEKVKILHVFISICLFRMFEL